MATTVARIVGPRDGKLGKLGGIGVRFMVSGTESGGGFALVEHPMEPRALAAPMHRHSREDEYSFVLEGRVGADLGGEIVYGETDSWRGSLDRLRRRGVLHCPIRTTTWSTA